jgi:hypothetical protein
VLSKKDYRFYQMIHPVDHNRGNIRPIFTNPYPHCKLRQSSVCSFVSFFVFFFIRFYHKLDPISQFPFVGI